MRILWLVLPALLSGCGTAPVTPTPDYELNDLTGAYVAFFDRTQNLPADARVAEFKADMEPRFPGFYDPGRRDGMTPERYDSLVARSLMEFPVQREAFRRTAESFQSMLQPAVASFVRAFPDLRSLGRMALLHSLGEMDGGTRTIRGESYLVFGADVMARLYFPGKERAFFHHELFHVYGAQFFDDCDFLWCALWQEGLAVYVSEQLNPGATDADLLLNTPRPIRPEVDANLNRAVCAVRARLGSEAPADYASFFFGNSSFEDLPPRSGYYIGYLAAVQAGRTRSLDELAHLNNAQARPVLDAALDALATCPKA